IALRAGARVFATTSGEAKAARVKEAGAELVIDYTKEDVAKTVRAYTGKRGVDVVLDSVGEKTWMSSLLAVAKGGAIVTCGATSGPNPKEEIRQIFWKQIAILGSTMSSDAEFRMLLSVVAAGRLKPPIDKVFKPSEARQAYARMEAGEQHGKIVLVNEGTPWPDGD